MHELNSQPRHSSSISGSFWPSFGIDAYIYLSPRITLATPHCHCSCANLVRCFSGWCGCRLACFFGGRRSAA
ncbi:hypothetical protein M758_4G061500 [Ceratodon purpureus]|uniref:Uncharacterized protein n=1 Tax=Ceratodon purpureus TaxID=3225 RepID=A0A8T0I7G0_CERPU|nr:hypothetical protein KC19_4G057200 [Ceratodon purpureus]KAG0618407.1 hypothetical protein M758_4G061500 [Ceratodon purpureus]